MRVLDLEREVRNPRFMRINQLGSVNASSPSTVSRQSDYVMEFEFIETSEIEIGEGSCWAKKGTKHRACDLRTQTRKNKVIVTK